MLLAKIQESILAYKQWLRTVRHHPYLYEWETQQNFQRHWDPDDRDPAAMFDRCFQNSETRRLWQTENWYPQRMMSLFWRFEPGTVRAMFADLFEDTRELEARIGRFLFGCDALLRDYRRAHPRSVENNHYHDDYRMIALYLAFRHTEQCAPYDLAVFRQALVQFGVRALPQEHDLGRYCKVLRTLMTFLDKDPEVAAAMQKHLRPGRDFTGKTWLLAGDLCRFVVKQ